MTGPSVRSGGCQCGAVRFRAAGALGRASICHCRMCQKAFGNFFAPLVSVPKSALTVTGEPGWFASSNLVRRGFCPRCGTPLFYDWGGPDMEVAIGAFDDPRRIPPAIQSGVGDRMPFMADLADLPVRTPDEQAAFEGFCARVVSNQHPDHD